ncbi:YihY family inner membrane protein [Rubrobacter tropicus]|uniref:YihY family inner membrane protein n=1 Tax=Rubrobacter tropicus TaxID=2653851 RepID=A0A6G8Q6N1_9ACTN|nr:YihY/virulence factor BrkB family protein [Rubrobacter tropicus]QIN82144.1 YihY family inner membrane protein [Rubrobacter tropicus]
MEPGMPQAELRSVARRPARGSLKNFFGDLRDLVRFQTLKATLQECQRDDALGLAAQLAYYLILALFPFILFLVAVLDAFSSSSPQFVNELFDYLRRVMPPQVFDLIQTYTERTLRNEDTAPGLLSAGILGTIWAASGAFSALINALNRAYDVQETRPFWKVKGIAILMTFGLSALVFVGALLLIAGPSIGEAIAEVFTLDDEFILVWSIARWPAALLFMMVTVALLFYFAPDAGQPFRWITPGGFVGIALWVLASLAFNLYLSSDFNTYDKTYGSIGTVIVLLLYLYISSLTILFGATLNATLVRIKEEISGQQILDAQPANEKPDILDEEALEEIQDPEK